MIRRVTIDGKVNSAMLADLREVIAGHATIVEVVDLPQALRVRDLIDWTSTTMDVRAELIVGVAQDRRSVAAREVVIWGARTLTAMSFAAIGRQLGREPSTILQAHKRIAAKREIDADTASVLAAMCANFGHPDEVRQ